MNDGDGKKHGGDKHDGPGRSAPYPISRLAPSFDLVDVAREIQQANTMLGAVAGNKLEVIADQIRVLQEQAHDILEQARRDTDLHRAECGFHKRPGAIYHLYRRPDESLYFSMLSPEDWRGEPPHEYRGSYRLEVDMSFTPTEELEERDAKRAVARRLLGGGSE